MRARWSRAPLPRYTGKPAPVIFTPRSKSIRLYFLASSQCGSASLGSSVSIPPIFTTTLSSAPLPSGTISYGMFGMAQSCAVSSSCAWSMASCNALLVSLSRATSVLMDSASSFLPCFINAPICAASFLLSDKLISNWVCASRRFLSVANTLSIASLAPGKCFFSRPLMTHSVRSLMSFNVSILLFVL